MINRNSLTHYSMVKKLIKASREAVKQGYATVYNRKGKPVLTMRTIGGKMACFAGDRDVTMVVSSVIFD